MNLLNNAKLRQAQNQFTSLMKVVDKEWIELQKEPKLEWWHEINPKTGEKFNNSEYPVIVVALRFNKPVFAKDKPRGKRKMRNSYRPRRRREA